VNNLVYLKKIIFP